MNTEIEAKFLGLSHDDIRNKLTKLGAVCQQPMRTMQRVILDFPDGALHKNHAWARVRDEGDKVTITYKRDVEKSFGSVEEIEIVANSYTEAIKLMEALGLKVSSAQESRRETWKLHDVEIVLDVWPWVPPFVEIEGPNKEAVMTVARQLDLEWSQAIFGSITNVYEHYFPDMETGYNIGNIASLTFTDTPPEWFGKVK